ncbi:MAG TPA: hypothetical protein VF395_11745, partial [Polyangiaceae bacterium]
MLSQGGRVTITLVGEERTTLGGGSRRWLVPTLAISTTWLVGSACGGADTGGVAGVHGMGGTSSNGGAS